MGKSNHAVYTAALIGAVMFAVSCCGQPASEPPRTEIISTGDNEWMLWLPMDTRLGVETAIDTIARDFNVNRIWWRGGQDDMWLDDNEFRATNRFYYYYWDWLRYLNRDVKTNEAAIRAARRNGLEIWLWTGLFEYASQADAGGAQRFPYQCEFKIRIEHPDWVPVNKYGTRLQGGPVEFAYPQARKWVIDRLTRYVADKNYDGIVFYTYVENFSLRYMDEFGYNQPIVDEFKKRYGVDIRTQPFDKVAWAKLRGEYVTRFLRELRSSFSKHDKKICVMIEPEGGQSHLPMVWRSGGQIRPVGNIYMDWEQWVNERLVDEINVYYPGSDDLARQVLEICKGTPVKVSMQRNSGEIPDGVIRATMVSTGNIAETGFTYKNHIGDTDENTPLQPLDALKGNDTYAKRRLLFMIAGGKQSSDINDIIAALNDKDDFVRRLALRALGKLNNLAAVPAIENALSDPENSVRMQAAVILGDLNGPHTIDRIFETVCKYHLMQFDNMAACQALTKMLPPNPAAIIKRISDPDLNVRRVAVTVLQSGTSLGQYDSMAKDALVKSATADNDPWIRELSLSSLGRFYMDPIVIRTMVKALGDSDEIVQVRAAMYLTWVVGSLPADKRLDLDGWATFKLAPADSNSGIVQRHALELLVGRFKSYGDHCRRTDAEWGWRVVGNSIMCYGDEGRKQLETIMAEKTDHHLAERAWHVVYVPLKPNAYCPVTEQQDWEAHQHHPFIKF
jgi:hypothetical protein